MNHTRRHTARFAACLFLTGPQFRSSCAQGTVPLKQVEYHGKVFLTARPYRNMDAYRDSVESQFSSDVLQNIQDAVSQQSFGPKFSNQEDLDDQFEGLRFPGYGSFYANQLGAKLDPSLEFMYVELPRSSTNRYFAVERQRSGEFRVLADFTAPATPEIVRVRRAGNGQLDFMSQDLRVVHRRNAA
jgi:hypothetical protein